MTYTSSSLKPSNLDEIREASAACDQGVVNLLRGSKRKLATKEFAKFEGFN